MSWFFKLQQRQRLAVASSVLVIAFLLSACAQQYAEVSKKQPRLIGPPGTGLLAAAEQTITKAVHEERGDPLVALGDCLTAIEIASRELRRSPANAAARRDYNFAISRAFEIIGKAKLDPWTKSLTVPGEQGNFMLTYKPDPRPEWNPALYDFTPADQFDVHGKYVTERTTREGIGAPTVAVEREPKAPARVSRRRAFSTALP